MQVLDEVLTIHETRHAPQGIESANVTHLLRHSLRCKARRSDHDRYRVLFRVALEPGTQALQLGYRAGASLRLSLLRPTVPRWREDSTEHARALQPIGAGLQLGISCPKY